MRLGLVTYNLAADWGLERIITTCEETGFEGVELRTTHAHGVEPDLDASERKAVRKRFESTPVVLWGLGSACEYHSPDAEEVRHNIQVTRDFIDLARDVGAVGVKVRPNGLPEEVPVDQTLRQIGQALAECGDYAAGKGIPLWVEVHGPGTSHVPHMKTIMDVADHPYVQICWNSNTTDIVEGSIRQNFELLQDKIGSVHMRDLYLPDYPWHELVECLQGINYEGFCLLEASSSSADPVRVMHYCAALWWEMTK